MATRSLATRLKGGKCSGWTVLNRTTKNWNERLISLHTLSSSTCFSHRESAKKVGIYSDNSRSIRCISRWYNHHTPLFLNNKCQYQKQLSPSYRTMYLTPKGRNCNSGQDTDGTTVSKMADLRVKTRYMLHNPNFSHITVEYILRDAGTEVLSAGKSFLNSWVESCLQDAQLEMECLILLMLGSMVKESGRNKQQLDDVDNFRTVPLKRHIDFGMILILLRVTLDLHFQIQDNYEIWDNTSTTGDPKMDKVEKVQTLLGDIMLTCMIRKVSEMNNPTVLRVLMEALSDSLERMMGQASEASVASEASEASSQENSSLQSTLNQPKETADMGDVHDLAYIASCSTDSHTYFPRNELGACCEAMLFNQDLADESNLSIAARDFGLLLAKAAYASKHASIDEAEPYLEQALVHLSQFPDSASRRSLASVSKDFIRSVGIN